MIKQVFSVIMLLGMMFVATAQDGKAILPFADGKPLSADDIGFLNTIANADNDKSRGEVTEVTIDGNSYSAGIVIDKEDAKKINLMISAFFDNASNLKNSESAPEVEEGTTRGCGYYCYYYYWDPYCYCYRYVNYWCCI